MENHDKAIFQTRSQPFQVVPSLNLFRPSRNGAAHDAVGDNWLAVRLLRENAAFRRPLQRVMLRARHLFACRRFPVMARMRCACKRDLPGYNGGMNARFFDFDALRTLIRHVGAALVIAGVVRAFLVQDPMGEPVTVVIIGIVSALVGCIQNPKGGTPS